MIFEKIIETDNLMTAWHQVHSCKAPPGIDKISREAFEKNLSYHISMLQKQLKDGTYSPLPVVVFNEKKENSKGFRAIGISTVRDRVVQRAVFQILSPYFENHYFLPCSYAYRPGKGALAAIQQAGSLIKSGHLWVLQMDIAQFFDSIDHTLLLDLIQRVTEEKPVIRLISKLLKHKIFKEMGLFDTTTGAQQGSGLSPLLSNIYLHPSDHFLWDKYHTRYLRYSDDITLFAKEKETLEQAKILIEKCLKEMKLAVNEQKTSIQHISEGIVYLGYFMDAKGRGPDKKSIGHLENRLKTFDKLRKTDRIDDKLKEITPIIRGWYNYYHTIKPVTPPNILSVLALVKLAVEIKESSAAKEFLKKAQNFKYAHPELAYQLGEQFESFGMQKQAMREYARALELEPTMECAKERIRSLQEKEPDIHQAIEKIQLVLHHNPNFREGYQKLAQYYSELGLYGFAEKAHQKALEIDPGDASDDDSHQQEAVAEEDQPHPEAPAAPEIESNAEPISDGEDSKHQIADADIFLSVFKGRGDVHAKQWVDERGRWGFVRVERPMNKKDAYKHLNGELTLAVYPVLPDDSLNFIVFDVDTAKRKLLESDTSAVDRFRNQSHGDILRIKAVCDDWKVKLYIEDSGYKGRHGWVFFSESIPAPRALKLGELIMKKAGGPSEGMIWELFPMGKSDRHNSIIKLPLGLNRKNNRRCLFLSDDNKPIQHQGLILKTIKTNEPAAVDAILSSEDPVKPSADILEKETLDMSKLTPGLQKMLTKCALIRRLVQKAKDTNYLTHYERLCLLYTLSFAGAPGCDFLHQVISYCINYDRHITQKQIDRRKASPMSCARIWEYLPELTKLVGCQCSLKPPSSGYPSPVLYLVEYEIEAAMEMPPVNPEKTGIEPPSSPEKHEEPMEKQKNNLLNFNQIFSKEDPAESKERAESFDKDAELAEAIPTDAIESWELNPIETVNAVEDPYPSITSEKQSEAPLGYASIRANDSDHPQLSSVSSTSLEVWNLTVEFMKLRSEQESIQHQLTIVQDKLKKRFEDSGTNEIRTPAGVVRKVTGSDGVIKWRLEG